ncbi:geranylgeranyl reductase family protein [Halobacterium sp. CBA1126]|uniref:geranylgeranyl reductase family protein n=1 Tax=Halobacterium sp. CBA1126 TaxID=2668074 RepID=UPI0012F77D67|nr:geranylgeranyl reductase family protein [Halobacterium sp. CBA1126]MUV60854.1 geranylgeranyl reductase family protein [Halobacterium sp. CBA1126]
MYDFAVVGVGPAGARFARRAAERGYDVVAFESGELGKPLACSGHVSLDVWEFVPEDAREELFQNAIHGARFHLGGADSEAHPFYKDDPISNAVDRVQLDKVLADAARDAGADVREQHTVTGVEEFPDRVELTVRGPEETFDVTAKMVAGSDGPRSRVRDALGLPEPDEFLHGALAFDPEPDHADFVDVHLTVPEFFAWRIPRGEGGVEYGLAAAPGEDVPALFDALVDDYGVDVEHRCSGIIPIGPPDRVTSTRGFLLGDAAGQTKPFTGGGILYGMTAADCAAREVDPDRPTTLSNYESAWRDELGRDIQLGHLVRKGYSAPEPVQRAGMRLFEGEIGVHMDQPTSLFSTAQLRALLK